MTPTETLTAARSHRVAAGATLARIDGAYEQARGRHIQEGRVAFEAMQPALTAEAETFAASAAAALANPSGHDLTGLAALGDQLAAALDAAVARATGYATDDSPWAAAHSDAAAPARLTELAVLRTSQAAAVREQVQQLRAAAG